MEQDQIDQQISDTARGSLPKWPQMIVSGEKVTEEQAFEIIFRTDEFLTSAHSYSGGNNHRFNDWYREAADLNKLQITRKYPEGHEYKDVDWHLQEKLREALKVISTEYVHNTWASSSFIFGPHGWCHPDGTISYTDNVGKWPSIREVYNDWEKLAKEFQFLDVHVTLMSGEQSEDDSYAVINFHVHDGVVDICAPDESVHNVASRDFSDSGLMSSFLTRSEQGLPLSWCNRAADLVKDQVQKILENHVEEIAD